MILNARAEGLNILDERHVGGSDVLALVLSAKAEPSRTIWVVIGW